MNTKKSFYNSSMKPSVTARNIELLSFYSINILFLFPIKTRKFHFTDRIVVDCILVTYIKVLYKLNILLQPYCYILCKIV